jgi:hypothetical protein
VDELSRNAQQLSDLVRAVGETLDGLLVIRRSDDEVLDIDLEPGIIVVRVSVEQAHSGDGIVACVGRESQGLAWSVQPVVTGMVIWPQIDDQRQRSLVTAGAQTTNTPRPFTC